MTNIETERDYTGPWLHAVGRYTWLWLDEPSPLCMDDIPWRDWYDAGQTPEQAARHAMVERGVLAESA